MPRKESEAVPEGNGPVPQQEDFGSGQPTLGGCISKDRRSVRQENG